LNHEPHETKFGEAKNTNGKSGTTYCAKRLLSIEGRRFAQI